MERNGHGKYIYTAVVLVVSRVVLKQLFLHMNQERCSPKKGKTKRRKKERVIEINICTVNFEEVNMPYSMHNKDILIFST